MKIKAGLLFLTFTLVSAITVYGQSINPCSDTDPDNPCPIDSWVILLVAASSIFAIYTLLKRKKHADAPAAL